MERKKIKNLILFVVFILLAGSILAIVIQCNTNIMDGILNTKVTIEPAETEIKSENILNLNVTCTGKTTFDNGGRLEELHLNDKNITCYVYQNGFSEAAGMHCFRDEDIKN